MAKRTALLVVLGLVGCNGGTTETGFDVTFVPQQGVSVGSGGYEVEVRRANGEPIEGLEPVFVPFVAGDQVARLAIDDSALLGDNDRLSARIVARVVLSEGAEAIAFGSTEVVFVADELASTELELYPLPSLGNEDLTAAFLSSSVEYSVEGDSVVFEWQRAPATPGYVYHAWILDDPPRWLGVLNDEGMTDIGPEAVEASGPLLDELGLELLVSAESADLVTELVQPIGPRVLRGSVPATVRSLVQSRLPTLATLAIVFDTAVQHAGFAASNDTTRNIQDHTEHVANILSEDAPFDFDGGGNEDPALDDRGIAEGPLTLLDTLVIGLEGAIIANSDELAVPTTIAAELVACEQELRGNGGKLDVAIMTAQDYSDASATGVPGTDPDPQVIAPLEDALFENLDEVLGRLSEPPDGFLCLRERLERIGTFYLAPPQ